MCLSVCWLDSVTSNHIKWCLNPIRAYAWKMLWSIIFSSSAMCPHVLFWLCVYNCGKIPGYYLMDITYNEIGYRAFDGVHSPIFIKKEVVFFQLHILAACNHGVIMCVMGALISHYCLYFFFPLDPTTHQSRISHQETAVNCWTNLLFGCMHYYCCSAFINKTIMIIIHVGGSSKVARESAW